MSGWSLSSTPEFQTLADGFNATNPKYKVELKEYDATNYDTQMTADLAAGSAPDVFALKNLKFFYTYQSGDQLVDVSDVAAKLDKNTVGVSNFAIDGKTYAVPYRQDGWVLYYNKDLFAKAGVAIPDGTWTWDDYVAAAKKLTSNLAATGSKALGTYQHSWQSTVQGFARSQTPGADILSADYSYLAPYYARALDLQAAGAQADYGTVSTNKLTYQGQFGKQSAAMMPMGSWYVATLIAQQKSGDADKFAWGMAPIPQRDSSTTGLSNTPITFGNPTAYGINKAISKDKMDTAKAFLAYVASEASAKALANIGVTPALITDAVSTTFFSVAGAPTDDLSKFAFKTRDVKPEDPVTPYTAAIQNILNDAHTSIMSKSSSTADAIAKAESRVKSEVLKK